MPDGLVIGVPDGGGILLVGGGGVAEIQVKVGVRRRNQQRHTDPGDQQAVGTGVAFELMRQLVGAVPGGEQEIVAVRLGGERQRTVGQIDQHREVGERPRNVGGVDLDRQAVTPGGVIPRHGGEGDAGGLGQHQAIGRVRGRVGGGFAHRIQDGEGDDAADARGAAGRRDHRVAPVFGQGDGLAGNRIAIDVIEGDRDRRGALIIGRHGRRARGDGGLGGGDRSGGDGEGAAVARRQTESAGAGGGQDHPALGLGEREPGERQGTGPVADRPGQSSAQWTRAGVQTQRHRRVHGHILGRSPQPL